MDRFELMKVGGGLLLIILTNLIALFGVAYNRQEPPESMLTLTERELSAPGNFMWAEDDNSGLSLQLNWRVESSAFDDGEVLNMSSFGRAFWGGIPWLNKGKLAELGFDVAMPANAPDSDTHYNRMLAREVLLVLELDGPASARAVERVHRLAAYREGLAAANPNDKSLAARAQDARSAVNDEESNFSRLFVVDAGLDGAALRIRYPDRSHYAIVRGSIRPGVFDKNKSAELSGNIVAVRCESINVPLQFRSQISFVQPAGRTSWSRTLQPFSLQAAFGRRLEPWIVSARKRSI